MQTRRHVPGVSPARRAWLLGIWVAVLLAPSLQTASAQDAGPRRAKVIFTQLNDSGVDGSASLQRKGGRTVVRIRADGAMGDHPTHIHQGSCDDLDPNPEFPLTNVQLRTAGLTGMSDTTIGVPLADLLDEPHLIIIHKSAKDIGSYLACGDIVAGKLTSGERTSTDATDPLPKTGVGSLPGGSSTTIAVLLAWALAALLTAYALLDRSRAIARVTAPRLVRRR